MPLQMKDPLELSIKRREFLPGSVFLSHRDITLAVESNVKTNTFPLSVTSHYEIFSYGYE